MPLRNFDRSGVENLIEAQTMRMRQHVNPLGLSFEEFRGIAPELPPDRAIEVEIGCADAQFLFERAVLDPGRIYVGFEVRSTIVDDVNQRAQERGLPVHAVFANANMHMRGLLPPASVDCVHVNFPDPWFKRRHEKRRMLDSGLARDICRVLKPGGQLFFQSDVWHLALTALELFEEPGELLTNLAGEWAFWKEGNPFGARSWREVNAAENDLPVWRILYQRTEATVPAGDDD